MLEPLIMLCYRYLAAKTHYFGVGGGTRQFEELVNRDGRFNSKVVKTFEEGECLFPFSFMYIISSGCLEIANRKLLYQ